MLFHLEFLKLKIEDSNINNNLNSNIMDLNSDILLEQADQNVVPTLNGLL